MNHLTKNMILCACGNHYVPPDHPGEKCIACRNKEARSRIGAVKRKKHTPPVSSSGSVI